MFDVSSSLGREFPRTWERESKIDFVFSMSGSSCCFDGTNFFIIECDSKVGVFDTERTSDRKDLSHRRSLKREIFILPEDMNFSPSVVCIKLHVSVSDFYRCLISPLVRKIHGCGISSGH